MASHYRHYWGKQFGRALNLQWDIIQANSFVVITASEGSSSGDTNQPGRFVGDAIFRVNNVSPHPGGVTFGVEIGHYVLVNGETLDFIPWPDLLDLYTDFTVF